MNNGSINVRVYQSKITEMLSQGFTLGRLFSDKHEKTFVSHCRGTKAMHKDGKTIFVLPSDIRNYLNNGWRMGAGFKRPHGAGRQNYKEKVIESLF
jgi:hypothetical protein